MEQRCRDEIAALHKFFEEWFRGSLPETEAAFERVAAALAPDFEIVVPDGRLVPREQLLGQLFSLHGSRADDAERYRIWTSRQRLHLLAPGLTLATYEEWQDGDQGRKGRRSTALFAVEVAAPGGVQWLHVHETWLPPEPVDGD